jgi:hypothetical protein
MKDLTKTCISPNVNKLLTIQILVQKRTNDIVFDNDVKGCYDKTSSGLLFYPLDVWDTLKTR